MIQIPYLGMRGQIGFSKFQMDAAGHYYSCDGTVDVDMKAHDDDPFPPISSSLA